MTFQKETMTQAIQSTSAVLIVHATTAYIYTAAKDSARKEVPTMAEYINRERARFEAKRYFKNMDEIQEDLDMLFCMLPAENVAPVRHGRWIDKGEYAVCTECGRRSGIQYDGVEPIPLTTQFCPNCGAKMDGGAD